MFEGQIAHIKRKIDLALKTTVCGMVAMATMLVASAFFCAAAFVWIQHNYGTVTACLALGGFFLLLALLALIAAWGLQRRKVPPPPPAAATVKTLWNDPVMLAAALDLNRALGGRKTATVALIGAFVVGLLLSRPPRKRDE